MQNTFTTLAFLYSLLQQLLLIVKKTQDSKKQKLMKF